MYDMIKTFDANGLNMWILRCMNINIVKLKRKKS